MSQPQTLQKLVQSVSQRVESNRVRIAVVGDMILDNTIEGVPGGMHPETKVPILREATGQESIGGAANIALALSRLGVEVSLFGIIGTDLPGRQLENLLDRQSFHPHLVTERGWPTPQKDWLYRRDESGKVEVILRIDYDRPLSGDAREELVGEFRARCPADVQVVLLADHGLGCIGPESLAVIGLAKEKRARIVAIPRSPVLRGQALDAIVINPSELRRLAGAKEDANAQAIAKRYAREYSQTVFLSLLEEGLFIASASPGVEGVKVDGYPLESPDWMGVRDITASLVALGLGLGLDIMEVAQLSNLFRHLTANQRGNGRVVWRDVFQFVGLD